MDGFKKEAEQIIELLPEKFTSHRFYTLYAMGFPLSYLKWMEKYGVVQTAHNQISNSLRRLSDKRLLLIEPDGKTKENSMFGKEDEITCWKKVRG